MAAHDLAALIEPVARHLLGAPNAHMSTRAELRYGKKGSVSVDLKKGTWYDWSAGVGGGVVDLVARECRLESREAAVEWLRRESYLEADPAPAARPAPPLADQSRDHSKDQRPSRAEDTQRRRYALDTWHASVPIVGTLAEVYLRHRGVTLAPLPNRLRFYKNLRHMSGTYWPAMVALVTDGATDRPAAIHRTYLAPDGRGKAPVEPNKVGLGHWQGGAVKLAPPTAHVFVGEGVETCLAAMQVMGVGAWAALSTSGLMNLELPREVARVTVLADHDPVDPRRGVSPGLAAARAAAARWKKEGRDARVAVPPEVGQDFADMLRSGGTP